MPVLLYGFTETMRGTWTPLDGSGRKTMWFRAEADATDAVEYLRHGVLELTGKMHAEGLADEMPATGRLEIQPLSRRIGYDLTFCGDDGQRYRFVGEKTLSLTRIFRAMSTLPGQVLAADGQLVGTALLYFDLKQDLLPFLGTFRRGRSTPLLRAAEAET
ncbi:MAG: hypothetical protein IPI67_36240 [Myxococcales bacterium]|nr:hypothetical protein [Myxococcales bacterium]